MKNFLIITSIGLLLISPLFVTAAVTPGGIPTYEQLGIKEKPPVEDVPGLINAIADIVKWVYTIFLIVAVMFILIAAFNYLTAGGQPEKIKSAHTQLIYAAIAIAIALLAVGAVAIIKDVLQQGGEEESWSPNWPQTEEYQRFRQQEIESQNLPGGDNINDLRTP